MSTLDVLADELGAVAGRIEREASLRLKAALAELAQREAEREMRLFRLEAAVSERLANVRDGRDGEPGVPGRPGERGADGLDGEPGPQGEPGLPGADGLHGDSMEPRGLYDANADYDRLDIVALDGGSFIANRADPGPCPGPGWTLLVTRGKPGKPGEAGKPGPQGKAGAAIIGGRFDAAESTLVFVCEDGSAIKAPLELAPFLAALREE